MSRALAAMTNQFWAIDPSWIPLMASIAQRGSGNSNLESSREWVKRDHLAMAGPDGVLPVAFDTKMVCAQAAKGNDVTRLVTRPVKDGVHFVERHLL